MELLYDVCDVNVSDSCDTLVQERLFYVRMRCAPGTRHKQAGYIVSTSSHLV